MGRATDWYILNRHDDPTPGDLHIILAWEQYFADRQFDMDAAIGRVSSLSGDLNTLNFVGEFATAVRDTMREMATKVSWERDGYRRATDALQAYRLKLTPTQEHADAALAEGRIAYADHLNAQGMVTIHTQEIDRDQKAQTSEAVKQAERNKIQQQGKADAAQSRLDAAISKAKEAGDSLTGPRKDLEAHLSEALDTLAYGILNAHYNGDLPKPRRVTDADVEQARKDQGSLLDQIFGIDPKDNPLDQFWDKLDSQTDADVRAVLGAIPGVLDGATSITEAMTLMLLTDGLGPGAKPKLAAADGITIASLDGVSTADIWAADKDGLTFDPVKSEDFKSSETVVTL
ncbi:hypothetical protein QMK19_22415 [Streptomyces sp. H10-C2]|uniref:hypothetical protein n=1 Tax=unclassified Streptomyces TaxID=2593676 RepID=UPI0024BB3919|nr:MULTISPECIES: hypothetical protein [unclassified Streptomyces]MDJ0342491.1 hypothetical protein [Streptomyces sp. PH10-H1]MDJ0372346.1 hypothetical protein [Streptomyces sp. H10-C2]